MSIFDNFSKFLPSTNKKIQAEYYFGLNIKQGLVEGSVWGIEGGKVRIVSAAKRKFHAPENLSENPHSLIEAANIALDEALADFQPEPEKILFGVPDFWLADEDLKPKYSKVLKQLVKELDVVPLAYVASTHAICHFLQRQEGVPATAILAEMGDPLSIAVVKAGKILGTKNIPRGDNLPKDIEKALLSFADIEVLPAKIFIFGSGNLAHYKEEMVSFNWMGQLPFLHLPKIEELEQDIGIKSLSFAGASEINPHVHLDHQSVPIENKSSVHHETRTENLHSEPLHREYETAFIEGDIEQIENSPRNRHSQSAIMPSDAYHRDVQPKMGGNIIDKFSVGSIIPGGIPNPVKILSRLGFTLIIPIFILLAIAGAYVFLPKATVMVFVDPKVLEKETQIVADPKITVMDEANKRIAGNIVETTVNGTNKAAATGKKQIGDPAKGKVLVANPNTVPITISKGSILVKDGKKYTTDSSVTVPGATTDPFSGTSFKSVSVDITAVEIGPDSNISTAGTKLDLSTGLASGSANFKTDSEVSGGVSRDVTVVTSDDQKKLLASLTAELKKKAQEEVQGKLTGDMKILEETFVEKVLKQSFSKNPGDQASEFSLTLNLNLKGTAYSDADLKTIVGKLVETNVPEGYDLDLSRTETQATVSKVEKDGKIVFTAKFKAKLMPRLDLNKIRSEITFKSPGRVEKILKSYESVIGADIKVTPQLPDPLLRLPILSKNITLEINSN